MGTGVQKEGGRQARSSKQLSKLSKRSNSRGKQIENDEQL
jgi:hypothetical protein